MRGSENPNLMPKGAITVRMHSVGGWGAITTGKNLAMTLFELLGCGHQGQPEIRFRKEGPADHLLPVRRAGADPHQLRIRLRRRGAVARPQRVRPLQPAGRPEDKAACSSSRATSATPKPWANFPRRTQKYIVDNDIRVFYLDAFKIAREEASSTPNCNCACRATPSRARSSPPARREGTPGSTEETLFNAIEKQLEDKFGEQGQARRRRQPARGAPRLSTNCTRSPSKEVGVTPQAVRQGCRPADHAEAAARRRRQLVRHPPFLGTDRQLLHDGQGLRQPGRSRSSASR